MLIIATFNKNIKNAIKRLSFLAFLLFVSQQHKSFATNYSKIDSLKQIILNSTSNTNKVLALIKLTDYYLDIDIDSALIYSNQALNNSLENNYKTGIFKSNKELGIVYIYKSDYSNSIKYFNKALEISEKAHNNYNISDIYYLIGATYYHNDNFKDALNNYKKSLVIAKKNDYTETISKCYNAIGILHKKQGEYQEAIEYYLKALKIAESTDNTQTMSNLYNNIGLIYKNQELYDKALLYYEKSLKIDIRSNDTRGTLNSYSNIGVVYKYKGNYKKALKFLNKSLTIAKEINSEKEMSSSYINLANIYKAQGFYYKAMDYINKAIIIKSKLKDRESLAILNQNLGNLNLICADSLAKTTIERKKCLKDVVLYSEKAYISANELNIVSIKKNACYDLMYAYEKLGNYKASTKYFILYTNLNKNLLSTEKLEAVSELEKKYNKEKDLLLIEKLQKEQDLKNEKLKTQELNNLISTRQKYLLFLGLLVLLIIIIIIKRNLNKNKKLNKELIKQKAIIQESKNKAEDAIKQFENTIENLEDVYFKTNRDFAYKQVSPSMLKHLKIRSQAEIIGKPLSEFWDISNTELKSLTYKLIKNKKIKDLQFKYITKDKQNRIGLINATTITKQDSFAGVEGIIRDITKQIEYEKALQTSKNKAEKAIKQFEDTIENLEDIYFKTDRNFMYEQVSPSILEHLELNNIDEIIGKPLSQNWDATNDEIKQIINKLIKDKTLKNLRINYKTATGKIKYGEINSRTIYKDNKFIGVEGIIRDVTKDVEKNKKINELNNQKEVLLNNIPFYIFYKDKNLRYIEINNSFAKLIGKKAKDIIGKTDSNLLPEKLAKKFEDNDKGIIKSKQALYDYISQEYDIEGKMHWISTSKIPYLDSNNKVAGIIGVVRDITNQKEYEVALKDSKNKIEQAHKDITDNINYAKTIQQALLPTNEIINNYIEESFVIFMPKDQVSGDFYYINKFNNYIVFAAADCTGHGVSGGYLTILGITYLHDIVSRKKINNPSKALNLLRKRFKNTFTTFGSENYNGLDIALCALDTETNTLTYSGAFNPLWIIRNNELLEYKATRNPIGFYIDEVDFTSQEIQLQKNDTLYLFSDGYADQIGGDKNKKFKVKQFKELLIAISKLPLNEQKQELINVFNAWKGNEEQTDDVIVMGIKI